MRLAGVLAIAHVADFSGLRRGVRCADAVFTQEVGFTGVLGVAEAAFTAKGAVGLFEDEGVERDGSQVGEAEGTDFPFFVRRAGEHGAEFLSSLFILRWGEDGEGRWEVGRPVEVGSGGLSGFENLLQGGPASVGRAERVDSD